MCRVLKLTLPYTRLKGGTLEQVWLELTLSNPRCWGGGVQGHVPRVNPVKPKVPGKRRCAGPDVCLSGSTSSASFIALRTGLIILYLIVE